MSQDLDQLFNAFELSQNERSVFESLLGKGYQAASRIAKSVSLARNTTRNILDRLVDVGLVGRSKKNNSNYYRVESALILERSLTERARELERKLKEQLRTVQGLKPLLESKAVSSKKPSVKFYEGMEGAQRVHEDSLSAKETIRAWASFDANAKALPDYFKNYYRRRATAAISIKSIHPDTPLARTRQKNNKKERRTCVLVPEKLLSICPEIQVYDNKINLASWEDEIGILIESDALAMALKRIFDLCFMLAKK